MMNRKNKRVNRATSISTDFFSRLRIWVRGTFCSGKVVFNAPVSDQLSLFSEVKKVRIPTGKQWARFRYVFVQLSLNATLNNKSLDGPILPFKRTNLSMGQNFNEFRAVFVIFSMNYSLLLAPATIFRYSLTLAELNDEKQTKNGVSGAVISKFSYSYSCKL